ncbi:MAG: hypothetical protein ACREIM_09935, partial [Nitrospiraceae bacterium]
TLPNKLRCRPRMQTGMPKSISDSCCDAPKQAVAKAVGEMGLTRHAVPVKCLWYIGGYRGEVALKRFKT